MNNSELHSIFQKIIHKNHQGFDELYEKYYRMILGVAFNILKNQEDCNDVIQRVMLKLYTMPENKFPKGYDMSWLYTVVKNEALQFLRGRRQHLSLDEVSEIPSASRDIDSVIDLDTYNSMINSLDGKAKEIVTLKVISEMSHREIASTLNMPTGTVQWKYHSAVNSLRISVVTLALAIINIALWSKDYFIVDKSEILTLSRVGENYLNLLQRINIVGSGITVILLAAMASFLYKGIKQRRSKISKKN